MIIFYSSLFMIAYLALIFGGLWLTMWLDRRCLDVEYQISIGNRVYCRVDVVDGETGEIILKGCDYFDIRADELYENKVIDLQKTPVYRREEYVCGRACELYFWATGRIGKIKYKVTEAGRREGITL